MYTHRGRQFERRSPVETQPPPTQHARRYIIGKPVNPESDIHPEAKARIREEVFRLFDDLVNEVYVLDQNKSLLYANNTALENLGYELEEVKGFTPSDIKRGLSPEYLDTLFSSLAESPESSARFPTFHHRKDGSHYPVEVEVKLSTLAGEPVFLVSALDMTGKALTEERLKKTLEDLSRLNSYERVISQVTQAVHKSIDLDDVLENAVDALSRNMEAVKSVCIYLTEGDYAVMRAQRGYPDWFVKRTGRIPYPKGFTWKAILEGNMLYVPDTDTDTVMGPAGRELGTKSYLSLPLKSDGKSVGAINVNSQTKYAFGAEELRVFEIVSRQIEIAINNARYAESILESEKNLEEKVKQLSKKEQYEKIINIVTQSVYSSIDPKEIMKNAVRVMGENIAQADMVLIFLVEGNDAVLQSFWGQPEWFAKRISRIPYPKGLTWKTIIEGRSVIVPDIDADTNIGPAGREAGIKSHVAMPLRSGDETIGIIGINSFRKNVFFEDEIKLLEIIKTQIETAMLNARHVEALKYSEERYQTLADVAPIGIFQSDAAGNGVYVNDRLCEITGITREEAYSDGWRDRLHPDDRYLVVSKWREAVSSGKEFKEEYRFVRKDGVTVWVIADARPVRGASGEMSGLIGILTDITERKQSEEKIRFQASLLDQVRNTVVATDLGGRIIYWNRFAEELYGWKESEVAGLDITEVIKPEGAEWRTEEIGVSLEYSGHWEGELLCRKKDGSTLPVHSITTVIRDDRGEVIGYVGVGTDITEKKNLEARLLRTQRLESIGMLAGGIAHDLNNILQPILMSIGLLRMERDEAEKERMLGVLEGNARRGADLIRQVLSFARGIHSEKQILNMKYLLSDVVSIIHETFPRNIEVSSDSAPYIRNISGNYTQMHQVILNICLNARDAMPEGGRLSLTAENIRMKDGAEERKHGLPPGDYVLVKIKDTGCGIEPGVIDMIFDPFFTTKEPDKGTGLGLATAYGIVNEHGGAIHVESEVGKGSVFYVCLPAIQSDEEESEDARPEKGSVKGKGETVLVVDDEKAILDITSSVLEEFGYAVLTAEDGKKALEIVDGGPGRIDAAIVDMMMPVMNGTQVVKALKEKLPDLKIISVSGSQKEHELISVEDNLIDAFLPKPFSAETLLRTLSGVIGRNV
ncbi:MAG: PAS domain S-box protein [Candidatus Dadabacteria bacterium]|nr:PAS domain S-box protein [Candidatus Dadabacteria bacterium]